VNDVWDVVVHQQPFEKGLGRLRVPVRLQQDIQHRTGFIDGPPQPIFPATDLDAHLIQEPPGTPPGFPVAQFLSKERRELDVPLTKGFMADLNAALVQQFLDIALAEGKQVVKPEGMLNDAERKTVAARLAVSH